MGKSHNFEVDDSVVVKPNVRDPDLDIDIGGWQGRILKINKKDNLIDIEWDSITLKNMPDLFIEQYIENDWNWRQMTLDASELEPATPRDSEYDILDAVEELEAQYGYDSLEEQDERIQSVLSGIKRKDEMAALEAWEAHLNKNLQFPFDAEIAEISDDVGPLDLEEIVNVKEIVDVDDLYGLIVKVKFGRKTYHYPLCELEVVDQRSSNFKFVDDYVVWFANR